jgi:hypothetical protein
MSQVQGAWYVHVFIFLFLLVSPPKITCQEVYLCGKKGSLCETFLCSGHFIQHCPTNGDPNFDIKKVKPPTGIPKSMLMATPDGSYALPSGAVAVLRPNE